MCSFVLFCCDVASVRAYAGGRGDVDDDSMQGQGIGVRMVMGWGVVGDEEGEKKEKADAVDQKHGAGRRIAVSCCCVL